MLSTNKLFLIYVLQTSEKAQFEQGRPFIRKLLTPKNRFRVGKILLGQLEAVVLGFTVIVTVMLSFSGIFKIYFHFCVI